MKKNNIYYRTVTRIIQTNRNAYKIIESNDITVAEKAFQAEEKALKHREQQDWILTLERKEKGITQIIRIRSANEMINSPLF